MNARTTFPTDTATRLGFQAIAHWPDRWAAHKGKPTETGCLMSIAAEAVNDEPDIWAYAYDAATHTGEERQDFIQLLEAEFAEWAAADDLQERKYAHEQRTSEPWDSSPEMVAASDALRVGVGV